MARIRGTRNADYIFGTDGEDQISGYEGDDTFMHSRGNDTFDGGADSDTVSYANSTGRVEVDLLAGSGADGERGRDTYVDIENITGSSLSDSIAGDNRANILHGWYGDDTIYGRGGNDIIYGDGDNDTIVGGAGADILDAGLGTDTLSYEGSPAGVSVDLSTLSVSGSTQSHAYGDVIYYGFENVTGSSQDDTLKGNGNAYVIKGGNGFDTLIGSGGGDTFNGGGDTDWVVYWDATASVRADLLNPSTNTGQASNDTYTGIENLEGSAFDDRLYGDDGANVLEGALGHDHLYGRGGDDVFRADDDDVMVDGGGDIDTLELSSAHGLSGSPFTVTLADIGPGTAVNDYGTILLYGIENVSARGTFYGNSQDNGFEGRSGSDTFDGGFGNDTLTGNGGADTFIINHDWSVDEHDTITDFQHGIDRIDLSDTPVQDFNDLFTPGDRYTQQVGNDVVIHTSDYWDTSVTLLNVQLSTLTADDFLF